MIDDNVDENAEEDIEDDVFFFFYKNTWRMMFFSSSIKTRQNRLRIIKSFPTPDVLLEIFSGKCIFIPLQYTLLSKVFSSFQEFY